MHKANINQSSVGSITNNVNVNAQSGDASAERNTSVGDVTTGDAKAASSVANIFNTVLNVKHWFGVLVINVFGDWTGDVNHDTAAGNAPEASPTARTAAANSLAAAGVATPHLANSKVVWVTSTGNGNVDTSVTNAKDSSGKVLTAAAHTSDNGSGSSAPRDLSSLFAICALVMLIAGALFSAERKLRRR
jgi:hypothetical protein